MGWVKSFKQSVVDDRGTFEVPIARNQAVFENTPESVTPKSNRYDANVRLVETEKYVGRLDISDEIIRKSRINSMIDAYELLRTAYYVAKANSHYATLKASANENARGANGNSQAYDTTTGASTLEKDIKTLNDAAYTLTNSVKDKIGTGLPLASMAVSYTHLTLPTILLV